MRTWRRWRRSVFFRRRPSSRRSGRLRPWVGGVIGMVLALALIGHLELQLRPVLEAMAVAKVKNVVDQTLDAAVAAEISARGVTYGDLITIERDGSGSITALTSDMTAMNELRTGILTAVLTAVEELDPDRLSIPVESHRRELFLRQGIFLAGGDNGGGFGPWSLPEPIYRGRYQPDPAPALSGGHGRAGDPSARRSR